MNREILFLEGRGVFKIGGMTPKEAIMIFCSVCPLFKKCNPLVLGKEEDYPDEIKPRTKQKKWKDHCELFINAI